MKQALQIVFIFLLMPSYISPTAKKALIFGVTGQDGTYLAEFLLEKEYEVHGVKRRASSSNTKRLEYLLTDEKYKDRFFIHSGDLSDIGSIIALLQNINPREVYNLAAQSNVSVSFDTPEYTADVNAIGVLRILEAIVKIDKKNDIRFYQASSSEMFGKTTQIPQTEETPFHPRSPYGIAKLFGHWITRNYRESHGIFACSGILFNHESPLRGEAFVTRKITKAVAKAYKSSNEVLRLGNLDAQRDWGYAKDYVEAMWLILQQDHPDDYVIATGQAHTIREFVELAYKEIGARIQWKNTGKDEVGYDQSTGKLLIKVDPAYFRPTEVDITVGDSSKASNAFFWKPKTSFEELIKIMVQEDIRKLK